MRRKSSKWNKADTGYHERNKISKRTRNAAHDRCAPSDKNAWRRAADADSHDERPNVGIVLGLP